MSNKKYKKFKAKCRKNTTKDLFTSMKAAGIRTETSTARQFLFIMRCRSAKPEQLMTVVNRTEKIIADQGFEVKRMSKSEIKRFLAIYFETVITGEIRS